MKYLLAILLALIPSLAFGQADWGVRADGGTLYFFTNTVGSDGVAETPASEAIAVYKDNSTTELTTGASIDDDFDAKVGLHLITIDTTQSGFDAGSMYTVVYTAGTVDAVSIAGRVIGTFSLGVVQTGDSFPIVNSGAHGNAALKTLIDNVDNFVDGEIGQILTEIGTSGVILATKVDQISTDVAATILAVDTEVASIKAKTDQLTFTAANKLDANTLLWNGLTTVALPLTPTTAGRTLDVTATGGAGIDWANVENPTTTLVLSGTTIGTVTSGGSGLDAAGMRAALGMGAANLDTQLTNIDNFVDGEIAQIISEIATSGVVMGTKVDQISTDVGSMTLRLPAALVGGRMDSSVGSYPGNTVQTGDAFARLATYRLGELMSANLASQPFSGSLLGDLTEDNAGTSRFTVPALFNAPSGGGGGGGLTAQETADSFKLAPVAGAPASGSVYARLTDVEDELEALITAQHTLQEVGEEVASHVNLAQGGPVEQRKVPASRTIKLSRRSDGTYRAVSPIRMPAGETLAWALDLADVQLPAGDTLYGMVEPVSDDEDQAIVASYGVQYSKVILVVTTPAGADGGDSAIVTADVHPTQGETLKAAVIVQILNP